MRYSREQLIDRIRQAAQSIGFPEAVAIAQLARESDNFREDVVYGNYVGRDGERGLAQFIPGTWARFGQGMHQAAYDPNVSLAAWAAYTSYLMRLFNGDLTKVLQGYNGGEGNVQRNTVSAAARQYASEVLAAAGHVDTGRNGGFDDALPWGKPLLIAGIIALLAVVVLIDD